MASNLKIFPLQINENIIKDTIEKIETLRVEVFNCFNVKNNLNINFF